jgi:hypothetical protein
MRNSRTVGFAIALLTLTAPLEVGLAGQGEGKKGMVVVKEGSSAPSVDTCGDAARTSSPSGAKALFFDPTSHVLLSQSTGAPQSHKSKPRKRTSQPEPSRTPSQATNNVGLRYWIELKEPDGQLKRVARTRGFRTGEKIRLHFESNANGYIAIVNTDSTGVTQVLFPKADIRNGNNAIDRSRDYVLPSEDAWLQFDRTTGSERLTVFFASSRDVIDRLVSRPSSDANLSARLVEKVRDGSKGLRIEYDDESSPQTQPAVYFVQPAPDPSSYIALQICLNHHP